MIMLNVNVIHKRDIIILFLFEQFHWIFFFIRTILSNSIGYHLWEKTNHVRENW